MSDVSEKFNLFLDTFKKDKLWVDMLNTREDSPWHREASVAEHTRMLIRFYMENFYHNRSDTQRVLSLVACTFHDVGKPPAEVTKFKEDRGEYRAYHGHEQLSARLWVDYAMRNPEQLNLLRLTLNDVSNIAFMIEHHLPFGIEKPQKLKALKTGFMRRLGESGHRAWIDQLVCDQHGRISDDQAGKLERFEDWLVKWGKVEV